MRLTLIEKYLKANISDLEKHLKDSLPKPNIIAIVSFDYSGKALSVSIKERPLTINSDNYSEYDVFYLNTRNYNFDGYKNKGFGFLDNFNNFISDLQKAKSEKSKIGASFIDAQSAVIFIDAFFKNYENFNKAMDAISVNFLSHPIRKMLGNAESKKLGLKIINQMSSDIFDRISNDEETSYISIKENAEKLGLSFNYESIDEIEQVVKHLSIETYKFLAVDTKLFMSKGGQPFLQTIKHFVRIEDEDQCYYAIGLLNGGDIISSAIFSEKSEALGKKKINIRNMLYRSNMISESENYYLVFTKEDFKLMNKNGLKIKMEKNKDLIDNVSVKFELN